MKAPGAGRHAISRWLWDRARAHPDALAVESQGRRLSYAGLRHRALAIAAHLESRGLGPGDRIATVTENDIEHVALLFACARSGMALVPLNWRLTPAELRAQLDIAAPALVAASHTHWQRADEAVRTSTLAPPLVTLAELAEVAERSGTAPSERLRAGTAAGDDDPLLIVFTSGTTGRPKGAVLTQANCFWTNLSLDCAVALGADDVVLQVLPQCHVGGWNVQPLQAWLKGATVLLEREFDPERVLDLVQRRRVTTMMGVPTTYQRLAELNGFEGADLTSLRQVIVGGAPMPPELVRTWQRRGVGVCQGYGLTEAAPNVLFLAAEDALAHPGSVGHPYTFVDVELHGTAGGEVVEGEGTGEVWVAGPNVFAGYWCDAAATAEVMAGEWLRTGDIAERDSHGYYRICGRAKEMYISGGENVYPAEVEAVLSEHHAVAGAAVIGVPHERWGETGVAFVQLRADGAVSVDDLLAYCRSRLAGFKRPRRVVLVDQLPRLATGKLDKRRLAAMAAQPEEMSS